MKIMSTKISMTTDHNNPLSDIQHPMTVSLDGAVAKSSANRLVGTVFVSRQRLQHLRVVKVTTSSLINTELLI